jgi:hypothetical protein
MDIMDLNTSSPIIENRIFTLRGVQVMIDSDLAEIYQIETKVLNQAVKRNIERFPETFRFQLIESELQGLRSQFATTSNLKSQTVTSRNDEKTAKGSGSGHGGRRTLPYAFTEQGVAMLSAVLRSDIAVRVSIQIMQAFIQMRKTIGNHQQLLQLSDDFTKHKLEAEQNFEKIFKALEAPDIKDKQVVFFDGQIYDAYQFVNILIKKAKTSIILIDNYIDDTVITQLTAKHKGVKVYLLSKNFSKKLQLDIQKANEQYPLFKAISFAKAHDCFLIIDKKEVYHIGASLKDLGKKWFAFSKMKDDSFGIVNNIKELI